MSLYVLKLNKILCNRPKTWNYLFMIFHRMIRVSNLPSCKLVRNYFCEHNHNLGTCGIWKYTTQHWHFLLSNFYLFQREKYVFMCFNRICSLFTKAWRGGKWPHSHQLGVVVVLLVQQIISLKIFSVWLEKVFFPFSLKRESPSFVISSTT